MKKLLLNFYLVASLCLNAPAGHAEAIAIGHAFGRDSLTEARGLMGLGDVLSGVLPRTLLPDLASKEMQISSWSSPISQGADKDLITGYSGCDSTFGPPSNPVLGSRGKPERSLKVPEPLPLLMVGNGLFGILVLCKANSLRDRIRIRDGYSGVQTRYW